MTFSIRTTRPTKRGNAAFGLFSLALAGTLALGSLSALALPRQDAAPTKADADSAKTYTLTRTYKKEETNNYKLELRTKMSGMDVYFNTIMHEVAKEVKPDGATTLAYSGDTAYLKFGDQDIDASDSMPKITQTLDKTGKVTDFKATDGEGPLGQIFGGVFAIAVSSPRFFYPTTAVKTGDEWKIDTVKDLDKNGKVHTVGTAKVLDHETVGGLDTLKIKVSADAKGEGAAAGQQQHIETTGNIEASTGRFVRMNGSTEGTFGPTGKVKLGFSTTLMKGDNPIDAKDPKPKDTASAGTTTTDKAVSDK